MSVTVKITAKEVNQLRKQTGAGMMDCKKALVEANGDFEQAIEILRKKGQKIAAKRADRAASEGAAIAKTTADGTRGIVVVLACETDFVAKNADFVKFANQIADAAIAHNPENIEQLLTLEVEGGTIASRVLEETGKIGEKIEVSKYQRLSSELVVPYIHMGNRIGVLVAFNKAGGEDFLAAGRDVAMQVAAMSPVAVDEHHVDEATKAKELEIGREQALAEGKPEKMLDKIAEGKLKRFYKDNTLLNQQFVKNSKQNVQAFLHSIDKELTVSNFARIAIG